MTGATRHSTVILREILQHGIIHIEDSGGHATGINPHVGLTRRRFQDDDNNITAACKPGRPGKWPRGDGGLGGLRASGGGDVTTHGGVPAVVFNFDDVGRAELDAVNRHDTGRAGTCRVTARYQFPLSCSLKKSARATSRSAGGKSLSRSF